MPKFDPETEFAAGRLTAWQFKYWTCTMDRLVEYERSWTRNMLGAETNLARAYGAAPEMIPELRGQLDHAKRCLQDVKRILRERAAL